MVLEEMEVLQDETGDKIPDSGPRREFLSSKRLIEPRTN
jgi:hypothetical protein